jgi:transcription elongation factor Elf1
MKLTAQCLRGHVETLTPAQIKNARRDGVVMCKTCGDIAIIKFASRSARPPKTKPKK